MDYATWCFQSNDDLARRDMAEVHLNCAVGLPGAEGMDVTACLTILDAWAEKVRLGISRAMRNREHFPEYAELSEAEYQILTMYSVLYRHLGLTPNPDMMLGANHAYGRTEATAAIISSMRC